MNDQSRITNEHLLSISWHDSAWIPLLGPHNVMDYFSERSNPFYDRTCNNEVLKMQRASPEQLANMQGVEYCLLFVQEPILYVIRKQHRHSPSQVTPISDYYIIAGIVYQAPDIGSVLNSRILSAVSHLQSAFEEARGFARYHPSRGYWWDFKGPQSSNNHQGVPPGAKPLHPTTNSEEKKKKLKPKKKEEALKVEPSSVFQRQRVDVLLDLITRKFPPKVPQAATAAAATANSNQDVKPDVKDFPNVAESIKSEKSTEPAQSTIQERGLKRDASTANIRETSREGKKMKL